MQQSPQQRKKIQRGLTKLKSEQSPTDIEIQQLCLDIGIDYETEKEKYMWFLQEIVSTQLDGNIAKQVDNQGHLWYINQDNQLKQDNHPYLAFYRKIFYELSEKEINLECYQTTIKNQIQEFQNKQNVNKIITEDFFDKNSKTQELLKILKNAHQIIGLEQDGGSFIKDIEEQLQQAQKYYEQEYGEYLIKIPAKIITSDEYNLLVPYEVARNLQILEIDYNEGYLFFYGRLYQLLELPPLWRKIYDPVNQVQLYVNSQTNLEFCVHPCYYYLKRSISYLKQNKKKITELTSEQTKFEGRIMPFQDQLLRVFEIDMGELLLQLMNLQCEDASQQQKIQDMISEDMHKKNRIKKMKDKKQYMKNRKKKEIMSKIQQDPFNASVYQSQLVQIDTAQTPLSSSINSEHSRDEDSRQVTDDQQMLNRYDDPNKKQDKISDVLILKLAQELLISLEQSNLLQYIEEFVKDKISNGLWYYKIQDDDIIWVNKLNNRQTLQYPYLNDLRSHLESIKNQLVTTQSEQLKKFPFQINDSHENEFTFTLAQEKYNFLQHILNLHLQNTRQSNLSQQNSPDQKEGYDFKALYDAFGIAPNEITNEQIVNLLFYCPFDLTKTLVDQQQVKPQWLNYDSLSDKIIKEVLQQRKSSKSQPNITPEQQNQKEKIQAIIKKLLENEKQRQKDISLKFENLVNQKVSSLIKGSPEHSTKVEDETQRKQLSSENKLNKDQGSERQLLESTLNIQKVNLQRGQTSVLQIKQRKEHPSKKKTVIEKKSSQLQQKVQEQGKKSMLSKERAQEEALAVFHKKQQEIIQKINDFEEKYKNLEQQQKVNQEGVIEKDQQGTDNSDKIKSQQKKIEETITEFKQELNTLFEKYKLEDQNLQVQQKTSQNYVLPTLKIESDNISSKQQSEQKQSPLAEIKDCKNTSYDEDFVTDSESKEEDGESSAAVSENEQNAERQLYEKQQETNNIDKTENLDSIEIKKIASPHKIVANNGTQLLSRNLYRSKEVKEKMQETENFSKKKLNQGSNQSLEKDNDSLEIAEPQNPLDKYISKEKYDEIEQYIKSNKKQAPKNQNSIQPSSQIPKTFNTASTHSINQQQGSQQLSQNIQQLRQLQSQQELDQQPQQQQQHQYQENKQEKQDQGKCEQQQLHPSQQIQQVSKVKWEDIKANGFLEQEPSKANQPVQAPANIIPNQKESECITNNANNIISQENLQQQLENNKTSQECKGCDKLKQLPSIRNLLNNNAINNLLKKQSIENLQINYSFRSEQQYAIFQKKNKDHLASKVRRSQSFDEIQRLSQSPTMKKQNCQVEQQQLIENQNDLNNSKPNSEKLPQISKNSKGSQSAYDSDLYYKIASLERLQSQIQYSHYTKPQDQIVRHIKDASQNDLQQFRNMFGVVQENKQQNYEYDPLMNESQQQSYLLEQKAGHNINNRAIKDMKIRSYTCQSLKQIWKQPENLCQGDSIKPDLYQYIDLIIDQLLQKIRRKNLDLSNLNQCAYKKEYNNLKIKLQNKILNNICYLDRINSSKLNLVNLESNFKIQLLSDAEQIIQEYEQQTDQKYQYFDIFQCQYYNGMIKNETTRIHSQNALCNDILEQKLTIFNSDKKTHSQLHISLNKLQTKVSGKQKLNILNDANHLIRQSTNCNIKTIAENRKITKYQILKTKPFKTLVNI